MKTMYLRNARATIAKDTPLIKFTREPIARAYSGYLTLHRESIFKERKNYWSTAWRAAALEHAHGRHVDITTPLSFNAYLSWLCKSPKLGMNGHFAPQYGAVDKAFEGRIRYVKIEDSPEIFRDIETSYGLQSTSDVEARTFSSSGHNHKKVPATPDMLDAVLEIGFDPLNLDAPRPLINYETLQGKETTLQLLRQYFVDDLSKLGYHYEDWGKSLSV
ncbi:MAG: hypothetical protein AAF224_09325 [Pseudomonadota bacterium]